MEMLEYCKTYNMMKNSFSSADSPDLSSQNAILTLDNGKERSLCEGGNVVVETIQRLTGKPGDFALYHSVKRPNNDCDGESKKLAPLKEISRSKTMISTPKTSSKMVLSFESELTFTPKLNALSIKLAKERGDKMRNSSTIRRSSSQIAEEEAIFTFKPQVSSNSEKIVQRLKTSFLDRQMQHVERQQRHSQSDSYLLPYHSKASRLSPVHTTKAKKRMNKHKDLYSSIEEERDDLESSSPSKTSLSSSVVSNTSSTSYLDNKKTNESANDNKNEHARTENSENKTNNSQTSKAKTESVENGSQRLAEKSPYNQSVENLYMNKQKRANRAHQRGLTYPASKPATKETEEWNNSTKIENKKAAGVVKKANHCRTSSQPSVQYSSKMKYDHPLFEKVRHAKEVADSAMKQRKVFLCVGPYPIVRASLRRRGYVEKHYQSSQLIKKKARKKRTNPDSDADSASDDDSDDNTPVTSPRGKTKAKNKESPRNKKDAVGDSDEYNSDDDDDDHSGDSDDEDWKAGYESGGPDSEFNLMSRMVRNAVASFIWTVRRDDVDFKYLRKDQTVNHFSKAYSFTTKVGLCSNLRYLANYEEVDPYTFFPRCHRLGVEEDKLDFIDDFRMTSALSIIKWVIARFENGPSDSTAQTPNDDKKEKPQSQATETIPKENEPTIELASGSVLPVKALTSSLEACRDYLRHQEHLDVDDPIDKTPVISETCWNEIVDYAYQLRQPQTVIANAYPFLRECQNVVNKIKEHRPQLDIDGQRNIWIVKPGAKSRGRGIVCMDRLDEILKLTGNIIGQKEGRYVVQKYIERPLLIYGVKFDIRQWYLVTDWNPLTIWFYQDCYLRFCSQNFSLEDFHVSIHLANNSVQKNFDIDKVRDRRLPEENMWSSDEFKTFLRQKGLANKWDNIIYPGMKQAVIYAMESCQEIVEYRKNSFELYGADFIIGDDYKPWLIEINCSPTMGASTNVTRKLCAQVVEDTMKVVLDRKDDKNCDTGRFELAFKQAQVSAPPYIGVNLSVEGQGIPRKPSVTRRPSTSSKPTNTARPRDLKASTNEPRNTKSNETRDTKGESRGSKTTSNESRDSDNKSSEPISESKYCNGLADDRQFVARHNHFPEKNPNPLPKNNVKKADGSWALGQLQPKRYRSRSRSGNHGDMKVQGQSQQRGPQAMNIPKAILRYSSDNTPQKQVPISIGPSP